MGDYMWKMINYEVCGRGHLANNIPCQDKTIAILNKNTYIIALADGAGSAVYSHYGAENVINTISEFLNDNFDRLIEESNGVKVKEEILKVVKAKLQIESEKYACDMKELASTLLAVVVNKDKFLIVHLGDGIVGMLKDDEVKIVSKPNNGEFTNTTVFLTNDDAIQHIKLFKGKTEKINAFIIMSDGTGESFYDKRKETFSNGVKKIIEYTKILPKDKMQLILKNSFDGIIRNNTLDDCSIAVLVNNYWSKMEYNKLVLQEKYDLFGVNLNTERLRYKKICKYERILKLLKENPSNEFVLAKKVYIKNKYLKKELNHLEALGIIQKRKMKYYTNIVL